MEKEDWVIMFVVILILQLQVYVIFSDLFINVVFVLVVCGSVFDQYLLMCLVWIVLLVGFIVVYDLKVCFLLINWVEMDNVGVVMKMVEEGEVDVVVVLEFFVCYMIDYYYLQGLYYICIDGFFVVVIWLVILCDELVLVVIFNKVLQVILLWDILQMIEKWLKIFSQ